MPAAGHLLAATGPLVVGALAEATGGWRTGLLVLLVELAAQTAAGVAAGRPRLVTASSPPRVDHRPGAVGAHTPAVTGTDPDAEVRRAVLEAVSRALADLPALLGLLSEAEDEDDAVRRLQEVHGFSPVQAQSVLDLQFHRVTRARHAAVDAELRDLTDALGAPWDPPLHIRATVRSPQLVELSIADVEHRIEGEDLDDCLDRVVTLVRERLARPERRRVAVTTGLADGPTRILVDPVGGAEFRYAGDAGER